MGKNLFENIELCSFSFSMHIAKSQVKSRNNKLSSTVLQHTLNHDHILKRSLFVDGYPLETYSHRLATKVMPFKTSKYFPIWKKNASL